MDVENEDADLKNTQQSVFGVAEFINTIYCPLQIHRVKSLSLLNKQTDMELIKYQLEQRSIAYMFTVTFSG